MNKQIFKPLVSATLSACVLLLAACSGSNPMNAEVEKFLKTSSAEVVSTKMREHDYNDNGIRDVIEAKTGTYASDMTERLRYMAYAWSLQQAMEVALLGDEKTMFAASQMLSNTTNCLVQNTRNPKFAANIIDLSNLAADNPLRKTAVDKLNERTQGLKLQLMDKPCAQADTLAVRIMQQSKERVEAMRATAKKQAEEKAAQGEAKEQTNDPKNATQSPSPAAQASAPQKAAEKPISSSSAPK